MQLFLTDICCTQRVLLALAVRAYSVLWLAERSIWWTCRGRDFLEMLGHRCTTSDRHECSGWGQRGCCRTRRRRHYRSCSVNQNCDTKINTSVSRKVGFHVGTWINDSGLAESTWQRCTTRTEIWMEHFSVCENRVKRGANALQNYNSCRTPLLK